MNIDRYMVNLFFEIKRNLSFELRDPLKISDPNLGESMLELYRTIDNDPIKRLIEVFFERAGDDWSERLGNKRSFKRFGLARATTFGDASQSNLTQKTKAKPRYYRGALVGE